MMLSPGSLITLNNKQPLYFFLKILFIYNFRERGREEKERERNISVWPPLIHPLLGPGLPPLACVLIGNWTSDPLVHTGQHSVHWATPARAHYISINLDCLPGFSISHWAPWWQRLYFICFHLRPHSSNWYRSLEEVKGLVFLLILRMVSSLSWQLSH